MIIKHYRLTYEEIVAIKKRISNNIDSQLCYAVLLMVFKNLHYFPELNSIPEAIIQYVKDQLQLPNANFNGNHVSTIARHRKRIYDYYGSTPWKQTKKIKNEKTVYPVQDFVKKTALAASRIHNYPADIINVVVEQCIKKHFELPTFKQLDRLVRHARATVNQQLFEVTYATLSTQQIEQFDLLLETTDDYQRSGYNALKALPKNPTISNFRELLRHHDWLVSFGDIERHLQHIIPIKLKQFAVQARSLDASNLKDFAKAKRYTLILSLIVHAQAQAKDALAITFCRTITNLHEKAKVKLENLREFYRTRTQELLSIFSNILTVIESDEDAMQKVQVEVNDHGGVETLKTDCNQAVVLNSNNHLTFLLAFFKDKRNTLLRLINT